MLKFIIIFTLIYSVLNLTPFLILSRNLTFLKKKISTFIITLLISLPFITKIIENKLPPQLKHLFWLLSYLWLGFIFYLFLSSIILLFTIYILKNKKIKKYLSYTVIFFSLSITFLGYLNAQKVVYTKYNFTSNKLRKNYKLVFISDVHLGIIPSYNILEFINKNINQINPDLVILGGDIFNDHLSIAEKKLAKFTSNCKAPIIAIMGNHEHYVGFEKSMEILKKYKVKVLLNSNYKLEDINLLGVDDPAGHSAGAKMDFFRNLKKILPLVNPQKYNILLTHRPWYFKEFSVKHNLDLQLAGHTHKGQIYPFYHLVKLVYPYIYGHYQQNASNLIVSSGLGTWGPPLKMFSPAEVVIINLTPGNA